VEVSFLGISHHCSQMRIAACNFIRTSPARLFQTSKVDNFLLINFKIDREKKLSLTNNNGLFSGVFAGIFDLGSHKWSGNAKDNSHRTSFDFRMSDWSIDNLTENCIIKGGVIPKQKIYHLELNPVNYEIIK